MICEKDIIVIHKGRTERERERELRQTETVTEEARYHFVSQRQENYDIQKSQRE